MSYIEQINREIAGWADVAEAIGAQAQDDANEAAREEEHDLSAIRHLLPDGGIYARLEQVIEDDEASDAAKNAARAEAKRQGVDLVFDAWVKDPILRNIDGRDIYFALNLDATDLDMARRLVAVWGNRLRYSKALGGLAWDGYRWRIEEKDDAPMLRAAQEIAERMDKEPRVARLVAESGLVDGLEFVVSKKDARERRAEDGSVWVICHEELAARVKSAKTLKTLEAMCKVARNHLTAEADDLDAKTHLLTTKTGTIDLRTGEVLPHNPSDLITKMSPIEVPTRKGKDGRRWVAFDAAKAPTWTKAVDDAFIGDAELIDYVRRLVGYVLTGEITEQKFWFLYGSGSNMKGVFCRTLANLLPEHSTDIDVSLLMRQHGNRKELGGTNETIADLRGARLIHAEEGDADDVLDEGPMKKLSGGGALKAGKKFKSEIRFTPEGKIFIETNHRPRVLSQDTAIWRRIVEIPFRAHFADPTDEGYAEGFSKPKDPLLESKLRAEIGQIMAWAVSGAVEYYSNQGLGAEPQAVVEARQHYRQETDVLSDFIDGACIRGENERVRAGDLYAAYRHYTEMNATGRAISARAFGLALKERGYEGDKVGGVAWRKGLSLNAAGTRYKIGQWPDSGPFRWQCGNQLGRSESVADLPVAVQRILISQHSGLMPQIGTSFMTSDGLFKRVG